MSAAPVRNSIVAYRAEHRGPAEAHMRLSALHMERARLSSATLVMKVEQR